MSRTRSPWLLALILGSTLVATTAAGAADPGTPGAPQAAHVSRFQQALGLTDDQMAAIRQVHTQQAANQKQLHQSLRQAQSDLRHLALNGGDAAAIQAKKAEVAQLLSQSVEMRVESLQAIAPILTPEQRAKLAQMSPRGFGRHGHWHQQQGS